MNPPRQPRLVWLLALLAVLSNIVGTVRMPDAALAGAVCSIDHPAPGHTPAHHDDCAICPLCAAATLHAALPPIVPLLPVPFARAAAAPALPPPARAPPSAPYRTPFARGPPVFA